MPGACCTRRWGNGLPRRPSKQAALATALFVARVARLAWKAGGRPSDDGVTESRTGLAPSIKERRPWIIMPESTCHWNVCVVDANGKIVREAKVVSEPEALIGWFGSLGLGLARIGLEAGPLSQWLYAAMKQAGLAVELLETRHVSDAFKAMPVKSDRNDARNIAQLMRLEIGRASCRERV